MIFRTGLLVALMCTVATVYGNTIITGSVAITANSDHVSRNSSNNLLAAIKAALSPSQIVQYSKNLEEIGKATFADIIFNPGQNVTVFLLNNQVMQLLKAKLNNDIQLIGTAVRSLLCLGKYTYAELQQAAILLNQNKEAAEAILAAAENHIRQEANQTTAAITSTVDYEVTTVSGVNGEVTTGTGTVNPELPNTTDTDDLETTSVASNVTQGTAGSTIQEGVAGGLAAVNNALAAHHQFHSDLISLVRKLNSLGKSVFDAFINLSGTPLTLTINAGGGLRVEGYDVTFLTADERIIIFTTI